MNKKELELVASLLDVAAGTADERNLSNSFALGAKQLRDAIAQLEKAPEPWGYARMYAVDGIGECWELCADCDANVTLFTSPPEVAELQKQVQALQAGSNKSKEALAEAVKAIYFDDSSDFGSALWKIVLFLGGEEASDLLGYNEKSAYEKYVESLVKS